MDTFGLHLIIDAQNCDRKKLVNNKFVYNLLDKLPNLLSMTKMTLPYVVEWLDKGTHIPGISGFIMIAESHISIHTFPEKNYAFIDMFSCKNFDVKKATDFIAESLNSQRIYKKVIPRGKNFHNIDIKNSQLI